MNTKSTNTAPSVPAPTEAEVNAHGYYTAKPDHRRWVVCVNGESVSDAIGGTWPRRSDAQAWAMTRTNRAPSPAEPVKVLQKENGRAALQACLDATKHRESVKVLGGEPAFRVLEGFTRKQPDDAVMHAGELYGIIMDEESGFALDVYAAQGMPMERFKANLSAFAGNASSHAAQLAAIAALAEALENLVNHCGQDASHPYWDAACAALSLVSPMEGKLGS